jgi:hypothetical protein
VRGANAHLALRCFRNLAIVSFFGAVTALSVSPAVAEPSPISGTAVCNSDGTFTLTWTISNELAQEVTLTEAAVTGGGALSGLPMHLPAMTAAPYPSGAAIQHGIATAHLATVTVRASWADGTTQSLEGSLPLPSACVRAPMEVQAPEPGMTISHCAGGASDKAASYRIPKVTGVSYLVHGQQVAAGTHPAADGSVVVVVAQALPGYTLTGPDRFTLSFTERSCAKIVQALAPTGIRSSCAGGASDRTASYVIPTVTGVRYLVDGREAAAGEHEAIDGTNLVVTAVPAKGYRLTGPTTFSFAFGAPACGVATGSAVDAVSGGLADTGSQVPVELVVVAGLAGLLGAIAIMTSGRNTGRRSPGS